MNNISDPNATEMRGWVMLMLQRAAENVNPSECNDPAVLLACSLGSDSCPAACVNKNSDSEEEPAPSNISDMPIAGDLTIAVADYSDSIKSAPSRGTLIFNAVDFKSSEKVVIESVKLQRSGLSDKSVIKGVWFEKDGVAVSAKASLSTDGTVTTRFYNNYSVNGSDTLDLVVQLSGSAGAEIAFSFVGSTTTAKNVSLNTKTTTYRTTEYAVAEVEFQINGGKASDKVDYKVGDASTFEIGKFSITNNRPKNVAEDRDVVVKSLKLKNDGNLDLADTLKNVYVTRDGKTVSKRVELDGKTMTIYFDNDELASGRRGIYTIFAEIAQLNEVGRYVQLFLNKETELVANEINSNFRVAYTANANNKLKQYYFNGGKVTFTNDSNMSKTVNAAGSSNDVVIAKGTLTLAEPVRLNKIVFTGTDNMSGTSDNGSRIIKNLKLEIGGSTYNTSVKCTTKATDKAECVYTTDDDEIYVSKTSDIRVLVNLQNVADGKKVEFAPLKGASIQGKSYYDNSDESFTGADVAGSIQLATLNVKAGKFNLTNKSSSTKKVTKNSSDEVVIFDGEITAKEGRVSVSDLIVAGEFYQQGDKTKKGLGDGNQIDLTLYVDGEPFRTETVRGTTASKTFANLGDVNPDKSMKIMIKAQPNMSITGYVEYMVSASGTDFNGNNVAATPVAASRLQIADSATVTIASSSSDSTVIRDGSNAEILSFTATAKDGSFDLNELVITGKNFGMIKNATLAIDGTDIDSADDLDATKIAFNGLNETLKEGKHTFAIKANVSASGDTASSKLTIEKVGLNKTVKDLNLSKLVANSFPTISASTSSSDLILKIENPKDSEDDISILGFLIDGEAINASLKDSSLDLSQGGNLSTLVTAKNVSIAAGENVEFRIQAAKSATVQVKGIIIEADKQRLVIGSDYTNVGKWSSFKITANGDRMPDSYYILKVTGTDDDSKDTSITPYGTYVTPTTISLTSANNSAVVTGTVTSGNDGDAGTITWSVSSGATALTTADYSVAGNVLTITSPVASTVYTATGTLANGQKDSTTWTY